MEREDARLSYIIDSNDLRRAFDMVDRDKDGLITVSDIDSIMRDMGQQTDGEVLSKMMAMTGNTADSVLDYETFAAIFMPDEGASSGAHVVAESLVTEAYGLIQSHLDGKIVLVPGTSIHYGHDEDPLLSLIDQIPGVIPDRRLVSRQCLRQIISRWKLKKLDELSYHDFIDILNIKKSQMAADCFRLISNRRDKIQTTKLMITIGSFVHAPIEERVDFACRLLDSQGTGYIEIEAVEQILDAHFAGLEVNIPTRTNRIMKDGVRGAGKINRKQLIRIAKETPSLIFPPSRIGAIDPRIIA
jgi:Ca2+-binding EF-hand superfamily protein